MRFLSEFVCGASSISNHDCRDDDADGDDRSARTHLHEHGLVSQRACNVREALRIGPQILVSLLVAGSIEVWLSEYTEEHIMQYSWLHEEEYLKRQVHVALVLVSVLTMMSASRISGSMHVRFLQPLNTSRTPPQAGTAAAIAAPTPLLESPTQSSDDQISWIPLTISSTSASEVSQRQQDQPPRVRPWLDTATAAVYAGSASETSLRRTLASVVNKMKPMLKEVALTLLQGMFTSVGSPLLVFLVYVMAIGATSALGIEYRLHEHLTANAVGDLVITATHATILSVLVVGGLLHVLIFVTRAAGFDPDILVVPLAGAAGHFAYLFFFVIMHDAHPQVRQTFLVFELIFFVAYCVKGAPFDGRFRLWELLPAAALSVTLSTQYALINSAVYEKYPKVELLFSLVGSIAVIHASSVSSSFRVATARRKPYRKPPLEASSLFGEGDELRRVVVSIACIPGLIPLLLLHSYLVGSSLTLAHVTMSLGFAALWLPLVLLIARWSNHVIRHAYGKRVRPGCATIALLEFIQHLAQGLVYFYIIGLVEHFFDDDFTSLEGGRGGGGGNYGFSSSSNSNNNNNSNNTGNNHSSISSGNYGYSNILNLTRNMLSLSSTDHGFGDATAATTVTQPTRHWISNNTSTMGFIPSR